MINRTKVFTLILAMLGLFAISACASNEPKPDPAPTAEEEPAEEEEMAAEETEEEETLKPMDESEAAAEEDGEKKLKTLKKFEGNRMETVEDE